ncbi:proline-rich receptor-like protein kinase PERK2 [Miscanthus floridulus]|uniref:proline-rich receptor-like protein kinase PERK2 n=1 Tax=Miscanthus floridulus TaxID=154761 RepID=UPI00345988E2
MAAMQATLAALIPPPPPPQQSAPPPPPQPSQPQVIFPYGMPQTNGTGVSLHLLQSQGIPIQQIKFPSSPSPLPAWIAGLSKPIYTAPSTQPHLPPLSATGAVLAPGSALAPGVFYGGVDGPLFHSDSLMPTLFAASPSMDSTGAAPSAAAQAPLEFATSPMKAPATITPAVSSPASPTTPPALVSPMQAIMHGPTMEDMVPLSLPL